MGIVQKIKDVIYITVDKIRNGVIKIINAITAFFSRAVDMMRTVVEKLASRVRGVILGCAHFIRRIGNKYQEGTKNYSLEKEIGQWNETTVTRSIDMTEVPDKYKTMQNEFEVDDTVELNQALEY